MGSSKRTGVANMTRIQMTEMLSEAMRVPMEEAEAVLETSDWKLLDAAEELRRRDHAKQIEVARERVQGKKADVRGFFARFAPRRAEAAKAEVSADALTPLFLMPSVYALR